LRRTALYRDELSVIRHPFGRGKVDMSWLTAPGTLMKRWSVMPARSGLVHINAAQ
jgi:hypothetical protein